MLGYRKLEFFLCYTGQHFGLISKPLYEELITKFHIGTWEHFVSFEELKMKWELEKTFTKGVMLESNIHSQTLSNVLKISKENIYLHPTQKPVLLMEKLVMMFSDESDLVLDCFMGSGSTAVACQNLKRNFIGCELSEEYFKICEKRLQTKD